MTDSDLTDSDLDVLVASWLTLPEVADRLSIGVSRARQLVHDRQVLAVRRGESNALMVPEVFVQHGQVLKGLPGTLTLLADARHDDDAALRWLFTPDDSLPGCPVDALVQNRGTEIKRRAQALGF
ncbi:MAG: Rv2175c family DNA-binding protein [Sporichthyaceae bacterium]